MTARQEQIIKPFFLKLKEAINYKLACLNCTKKIYCGQKSKSDFYKNGEFYSRYKYQNIIQGCKNYFQNLPKPEKDFIVKKIIKEINQLKANENLGIRSCKEQSVIYVDILRDIGVVNKITVTKTLKNK